MIFETIALVELIIIAVLYLAHKTTLYDYEEKIEHLERINKKRESEIKQLSRSIDTMSNQLERMRQQEFRRHRHLKRRAKSTND